MEPATDNTTTMQEFCDAYKVTATAQQVSTNPNCSADEWRKGASHWLVTLSFSGRAESFHYSQGAAHRRWKLAGPLYGAPDWAKKECPKPGQPPRNVSVDLAAALEKYSEATPPEAADVLGCLVSDASSAENCATLDEFADEMGFGPDIPRTLPATFESIRRNSVKVRRLLGSLFEQAQAAEW